MSENGLAIDGSAKAAGTDRARMAANRRSHVRYEPSTSPDARGVLVKHLGGKSLFQLQEMYEVMDCDQGIASESDQRSLPHRYTTTAGR